MTKLSEVTYNCNDQPPRGYLPYGDGYDWIEYLDNQPRTVAISSWGSQGWDLGSWPIIVMAVRETEEDGSKVWTSIQYCEGDVIERTFDRRDELNADIDAFAEFYWRLGQAGGPDDIDRYPEGQLPNEYRGPHRWSRSNEGESNVAAS